MKNFLVSIILAATVMPLANAVHAEDGVVVVVSVPTPAAVTRSQIEAAMTASVPQYQKIPGLVRKYFTVGTGDFGGVYLFKDRQSADAWFDDAWKRRVMATYGAPARLAYSDVPATVDNSTGQK